MSLIRLLTEETRLISDFLRYSKNGIENFKKVFQVGNLQCHCASEVPRKNDEGYFPY